MLPRSLFRYYPANPVSLENLKRQCFYFGGVKSFNDPFECQVTKAHARDDPELLSSMRDYYLAKPDIPPAIRDGMRKMSDSEFAEMLKRLAIDMVAQTKRDFIAGRGVVCFSERNENLLMWSHYATGGSGFCLEFDTGHEVFEKSIKVKYSDAPPVLDALSILRSTHLNEDPVWINDMYCTKPKDWSYEQEWRVIHQNRGTVYHYPKESLRAIYFGPRCSVDFMEILCLILQGQNPSVAFLRGRISDTEYKVEFERVIYTSPIEAERQRG
jgi:hypothetical protein